MKIGVNCLLKVINGFTPNSSSVSMSAQQHWKLWLRLFPYSAYQVIVRMVSIADVAMNMELQHTFLAHVLKVLLPNNIHHTDRSTIVEAFKWKGRQILKEIRNAFYFWGRFNLLVKSPCIQWIDKERVCDWILNINN